MFYVFQLDIDLLKTLFVVDLKVYVPTNDHNCSKIYKLLRKSLQTELVHLFKMIQRSKL